MRSAPPGDAAFRAPADADLDKLDNGMPVWGRTIHGPPNATTYWLLYKSEDVHGKAIAVSGVISIPKQGANGPRPVAAWAHGTTGLGDQCAISKALADNTGNAAEFTAVAGPLLAQGYVVAASDYEGLGTDGVHPYLVATSEAHSMLDVARAALRLGSLTGADEQSSVVLWGHSQGGGAVLASAEAAPDYAGELHLRAAVAAAPVTDLVDWIGYLRTTDQFPIVLAIAAGFRAAYPELSWDKVLSPAALADLDRVSTECAADTMARYRGQTAESVVIAAPERDSDLGKRLVAESPDHSRLSTPTLVTHGDADSLIPLKLSQSAVTRLCQAGGPATLRVFPGATHGSIISASALDALAFLKQPSAACA